MRILAIESSCDETGVAIVDSDFQILGQRLASQAAKHGDYGGVVPELASRLHCRLIHPLVRDCLGDADLALADID